LDLAAGSRLAEDDKDLEIMLLRQQLRIVEWKQPRGPHIPRWQKVPLTALAMRLKGKSPNARQKLTESIILFNPETVLDWHRAVVRCKWTFKPHKRTAGRPRTEADIEAVVVQMARDNSRWGYDRIRGRTAEAGDYTRPYHREEYPGTAGDPACSSARKEQLANLLESLQAANVGL
jgi:hypothetical protein